MKEKPVVGQKVWSLNVGNGARNREQVLAPCSVIAVGRKYFTVRRDGDERGWSDTRFCIEDWCQKTDCSVDEVLYETEQQWYDEKAESEISGRIANAFRYSRNIGNVPLDILKAVDRLLFGNVSTEEQ